ncbi:serine/threonine-protein kinase SRPK3 [Trichoderma asperellum]|nr:protein kinase-like protein [Trichoderma asperelloides]
MDSAQDKPQLSATHPAPPQNSDTGQPPEHSTQPDVATEEIEEGRAAYQPGGFHPVYIGDIFNDRFKVLSKIGYGRYSTVWLVRDLEASDIQHEFRALKILSARSYGGENDIFEREILTHFRNGEDRDLIGYKYICHLISHFEHQGPNGTHVCFIFELMGETLLSFSAWFPADMIPYSVMRRFTIQLVLALDFAHELNVIHTDIKPDNIFVKFRDYSLIESGYLNDISIPQQNREEPQYCPIPSWLLRAFYFNRADDTRADEFDIALGDWGVASWTTKHLTEKIQPVALRSPEVLIEAPWGTATDWWNLGALILELFRTVRMFSGRVPPDGHYELKRHLTEIVDLFGPFPTKLLEKGNQDIVGKLFDSKGQIQEPDPLDGPGLLSEAWLPGLDQEQRECFVSFLKTMMKIDPEERPTPEDILRHPWLGALA